MDILYVLSPSVYWAVSSVVILTCAARKTELLFCVETSAHLLRATSNLKFSLAQAE